MAESVDVAHGREAYQRAGTVTHDSECLRGQAPPGVVDRHRGGRFVPLEDLRDGGTVLRCRRLDSKLVLCCGKECLPNDRVLEDVQEICGVSPQVLSRGTNNFLAELTPCRCPVLAG